MVVVLLTVGVQGVVVEWHAELGSLGGSLGWRQSQSTAVEHCTQLELGINQSPSSGIQNQVHTPPQVGGSGSGVVVVVLHSVWAVSQSEAPEASGCGQGKQLILRQPLKVLAQAKLPGDV